MNIRNLNNKFEPSSRYTMDFFSQFDLGMYTVL